MFGVDSTSADTAVKIFVAAVCTVETCVVFTPTASNPRIVTRQNTTTPRASVTSTSEKPEMDVFLVFMGDT
jgi:hypothetical protein